MLKLNWDLIDKFISLISDIHKEKCFTGVYGLPRGGLIPAVMISHKCKIPLLAAPIKGCLIVDDIADTGNSLVHYTLNETNLNKYYIATIFYKKTSIVKPDFYLCEKTNEWILFPWECEGLEEEQC